MLALKSKVVFAVLIGMLSIGIDSLNGQQLPSQRYQPVQDQSPQAAPPSVHVAPGQTRQLSAASNQSQEAWQGQNAYRAQRITSPTHHYEINKATALPTALLIRTPSSLATLIAAK